MPTRQEGQPGAIPQAEKPLALAMGSLTFNNKDGGLIAFCDCHDSTHQIHVAPFCGYDASDGKVGPENRALAFTIVSRPVTLLDRLRDAWEGLVGDGFESMEVIVPTEEFLRMAEEVKKFR